MADADRLVAALNYLQEQKPADPLESFRSLAGLKDAYERRVQPIINNAMQTFSTGGAIGDLLRSYGEAAAPGNAAALKGMGIPFKGPMTAPREEGVSSGENFRPMGDPQQQFAGQLLGDPMNVQPMIAPAARGAVAAGKYAGPELARGLENYMGKVGMRPSIMAGVGAKTANLSKLNAAQKMQATGIPDEQIWKETGWTGGFPDKQWRFEIPDNAAVLREANIPQRLGPLEIATQYLHDNGIRKTLDIGSPDTLVPRQLKQEAMQYAQMKMRNTPVPSAPIDSVLQHDELFKAYPEFSQYPFSRELGGSYTGTFDPISKNITAGGGLIGGGESAIKSTTLHELQHAVQERQGFARGGSPSGMSLEYNNARARLNFLEKDPDYITGMKKLDDLFVRAFDKNTLSSAQAMQLESQILAAHPALLESRKVMEILRQGNEYGSAYKKLAGEAEARLTQARMNMTPEQRAASYPPSMFDVPVEMQIVRK